MLESFGGSLFYVMQSQEYHHVVLESFGGALSAYEIDAIAIHACMNS